MNDAGYQIYRGDSSEVIEEGKPTKGEDSTGLHMENFLAACRSRKSVRISTIRFRTRF